LGGDAADDDVSHLTAVEDSDDRAGSGLHRSCLPLGQLDRRVLAGAAAGERRFESGPWTIACCPIPPLLVAIS